MRFLRRVDRGIRSCWLEWIMDFEPGHDPIRNDAGDGANQPKRPRFDQIRFRHVAC